MPWNQSYDPLGQIFLSAIVAAAPVLVLLGLLAFFHVRAHVAALAGLAAAWLVAVLLFGMPIGLASAAAAYGAAFGLFPIGWIVLNAIFIYEISVTTGKFEVIKNSIARLSSDSRLQALLIAFSFGAFLEGAAGFGTPVAISGAMLIGLGFKPLQAAGLALIGNTAPVAFGALGTPLIALAGVTNLPLLDLSAMVGRQLPIFSVIIPFWMIWAMVGWRGMREVWPACLATGASYALIQFVLSNYHGPWMVDIVGSIGSMLTLVALLRVWRPRRVVNLGDGGSGHARQEADAVSPAAGKSRRAETFVALLPWLLLSVFVFVWGIPQVKAALDSWSAVKLSVPLLDRMVWRMPPVAAGPEPEAAIFNFNVLSAAGTALLLSGVISGLLLRLGPAQLLAMYARTVWRVRLSLLTIAAMMALAFTTRYCGSDATMGLAFASTGVLFPFFSPLLGWLGVALTGSDTSSNVLFGNLQQVSARQIGVSPILLAAANSSGGVMGKMIDAQSIVVASVATEGQGGERVSAGTILRHVFWHSVALAILVGVVVLLQAYVLTWMIP